MSQKTTRLRVDGLPKDVSSWQLEVLFQTKRNSGGPVQDIELQDGVAIITFKHSEAVDRIMERGKTILINSVQANVQPVYDAETDKMGYAGVLGKSEHKLAETKLTTDHPCLSKKANEGSIHGNKNIPSLLVNEGGKLRPHLHEPAFLPELKGRQKTFYLSTAIETFHNKFQACFELTMYGNEYLRKHPETLNATVKQENCTWKLFNKKGQSFFCIQLDYKETLKVSQVKDILGRALDSVRTLLDEMTVLEFSLKEKDILGFQQICYSTKRNREYEVYVDHDDNTIVFISKQPPHEIQKIMNGMMQILDSEPDTAIWNDERKRGPGRGDFRGRFRSGDREGARGGFRSGDRERASSPFRSCDREGASGPFRSWDREGARCGFRRKSRITLGPPIPGPRLFHSGAEDHGSDQRLCTQQMKPRFSLSYDETRVKSDDRQNLEKVMTQKTTISEEKINKGGKKYNIVKDMELQRYNLILLQKAKSHKDIEKEYKNLIIVLDFRKPQVLFKGNDITDVESARFKLCKKVATDFKSLEIKDFSKAQVELLSKGEMQKKVNDQIHSKNFHAHFQCRSGTAILFYIEPIDVTNVIQLVKSQVNIHEESIVHEMIPIFQSDRGCKFLEELRSSSGFIGTSSLELQDNNLLIIGTADQRLFLQNEMAKFGEENKPLTERVPWIRQKQAFISRFQKPLLEDVTKSLIPYGTTINQEPGRFILKGPKDAMEEAKKKLSDLQSQICVDQMKLSFFGIEEFFREKDGKDLLTKVEESQSCILFPVMPLGTKASNTDQMGAIGNYHNAAPKTYSAVGVQSVAEQKHVSEDLGQFVIKAGQCHISFIEGDITTISSLDAFVNPIDTSCKLTSAVGQTLKAKGGLGIQREIDKICANHVGVTAFQTSAGLMNNFKNIIYMVCPVYGTASSELQAFGQGISDCLRLCDQSGHRSIGILPIIIGRLFQFPRKETCQILMTTVLKHLQDRSSNLSCIVFCDMNSENLRELRQQFENALADSSNSDSGLPRQNATSVHSKSKVPVPPPPTSNVSEEIVLKVYSSSSQKFQEAKTELEKECKSAFKEERNEDMGLKKLSKIQIRELEKVGLKQRIPVRVKLEGCVLIMQGFGMENFYAVAVKLKELLVAAVEGHHRKLHLASKSAIQWQFYHKHGWQDFDPLSNIEVEKEHQTNSQNCVIKDTAKIDFYVDFLTMKMYPGIGQMSGASWQIRRLDLTADSVLLPEKWDQMHNTENVKLITLEPLSTEFSNVSHRFFSQFHHTSNYQITKIERVQNKALYQQYKVKKREMDQRNPKGHENEMRLYHGTDIGTVQAITTNGFSRNYRGKNATVYGEGVYFAINSSYSHSYTRKDSDGNRMMFQARVLVGESTPSKGGMTFLPCKPGSNIPFDSGCARDIFIIFHDAQAYPEYIITYSRCPSV